MKNYSYIFESIRREIKINKNDSAKWVFFLTNLKNLRKNNTLLNGKFSLRMQEQCGQR